MEITVIGAGLAGCEAAWQAAQSGVDVLLKEQKPQRFSPAHSSPDFGELVCSNSLRADGLANAVGLLKEELRRMGSLLMICADETRVPAGGALAVDRERFAKAMTERIRSHPRIRVVCEESTLPGEGITVVATGPLTEGRMAEEITALTGGEDLHFFDAAAPIVSAESIDETIAYRAARYGKGGADYLNCPMTREEYDLFYDALLHAECAPVHDFEGQVFEGCMPIEVMAQRGRDTMLFGPLKPVGLPRPDGTMPYAVVQLRQDNSAASLYNIVGFQTHLKFGEQQRIIRMIPGLQNAEIMRYGVMHRNTYLDSPRHLDGNYRMRTREDLYFAGQMTGVEGYVESAASGLTAGIAAARAALGKKPVYFPTETAIGALAHYISDETVTKFQPMNINFGLLPALPERIKCKKDRYEAISARALAALESFKEEKDGYI